MIYIIILLMIWLHSLYIYVMIKLNYHFYAFQYISRKYLTLFINGCRSFMGLLGIIICQLELSIMPPHGRIFHIYGSFIILLMILCLNFRDFGITYILIVKFLIILYIIIYVVDRYSLLLDD